MTRAFPKFGYNPVTGEWNDSKRGEFLWTNVNVSEAIAIPATIIKGFAGAAACVQGIVRRIDCVEDGNQILPGEILVTTITNVGWTPLLPRLAAIVAGVGAPLSRAAIVAREMGIPAVVGCGNTTMVLKTGDHIRVDGRRGVVEKMKP